MRDTQRIRGTIRCGMGREQEAEMKEERSKAGCPGYILAVDPERQVPDLWILPGLPALNKVVIGNMEDPGKGLKFQICDITLVCFNPCDYIFIHVIAFQLEQIG